MPGDVVELTAIPLTGWTFDGWSGDAVGMDNPLLVTVDADLTISANFITGPVMPECVVAKIGIRRLQEYSPARTR